MIYGRRKKAEHDNDHDHDSNGDHTGNAERWYL